MAIGEAYDRDETVTYDRIIRLSSLFELDTVIDHFCGSYSSGQKKKLGICAALISQAQVLVLDEPLSGGLDSSGLYCTQKILQDLAHKQEVTVIMAVPVPELVEAFTDTVAIIQNGEILNSGTIDELKKSLWKEFPE